MIQDREVKCANCATEGRAPKLKTFLEEGWTVEGKRRQPQKWLCPTCSNL